MLARNLKNIKLITFDCTNTLLYFKNPPEKQYLITAAENGFHKEDFNPELMKKSFRKYFKDLNKEYPNFGTSTIGYLKWWEKVISDKLTVFDDCNNFHLLVSVQCFYIININ